MQKNEEGDIEIVSSIGRTNLLFYCSFMKIGPGKFAPITSNSFTKMLIREIVNLLVFYDNLIKKCDIIRQSNSVFNYLMRLQKLKPSANNCFNFSRKLGVIIFAVIV